MPESALPPSPPSSASTSPNAASQLHPPPSQCCHFRTTTTPLLPPPSLGSPTCSCGTLLASFAASPPPTPANIRPARATGGRGAPRRRGCFALPSSVPQMPLHGVLSDSCDACRMCRAGRVFDVLKCECNVQAWLGCGGHFVIACEQDGQLECCFAQELCDVC